MDKVCHSVHRVADADDDSVRRVLEDIVGNTLNDTGINTDEFFASHARFTGNSRSYNNNITAFACSVVVSNAFDNTFETEDISRLHNVHGFAFRNAFLDVEKNHFVGNAFSNQYICTSGANVSGTDNCNF